MKLFINRAVGSRLSACMMIAASLAVVSPVSVRAQNYGITNGNSTVNVNSTSQAGMDGWTVDGVNQLNQQWFWFRVGNGPQLSLDSLGEPTSVVQTPGVLDLTYTSGSLFTIETKFTLAGGANGSGTSGMTELIAINNISGGSLDFHFFEYADFNLPGSVQLGKNVNNLFNEALVTSGNVHLSEDIDTGTAPGANHGEAELYNSTLHSLTTTSDYTLNDNASAGSGLDHVTWALQWDTNFAGNGSLLISKVLSIEGVPEPTAWSLLSVGVLAFGALSQFRHRRK